MESPKCAESLMERGVKRVGDYLIERELGRGTFGRVFRCRSAQSGRVFAVKVIPAARLTTPHSKRLLKTEVSVMHAVSHPHVMHLHDFLKSQTNYYLVLDYCEGGDLFSHIRSRPRGHIEEPAAVPLFKQVMNGFAELRKHRVIHRDIKSENVFLRERALVIGDFGLAHVGAETASSYVGSRQFMAPEVLAGPRKGGLYDSRVDLWAIGCLFYEMLFGEAPFRFKDAGQMLAEIAQKSGERLSFPREVSPAARDLLRRLLHPDPQLRLDWHGFFNHALFDAGARPPDPLELPLIAHIQAWAEGQQRVEGDFRCNRHAELELPEALGAQPAAKPQKQRVEERYSVGERVSPHAAYFEEVTLRYLHERNKLWWTSYVHKKLRGFCADAQTAELSALAESAAALVAEKVVLCAARLLWALGSQENIFGVQEDVFADYVKHPAYGDLLSTVQQDQQALREATLPGDARSPPSRWADGGSPVSKSALGALDERVRAVHGALFVPCQQMINLRPEIARKLAYLLALLRTCHDSDAYFPFRRANASTGKFDWVKFYDKIENGTFEQLVALAR